MLIKAALNGARKKSEYSLIPQTSEELAHETKKCIEAGADAIHFHVYNENGKESLHSKDVEKTLLLVRKTCPGISFGISTGEWIVPDLNKRLKLIGEWKITPDFVSVNFDEENVNEVCEVLLKKKIKIEAGLSSQKDVENFLESNFINETIRILIEPVESSIEEALNSVFEIEKVLDDNKINIPRLLHGFDNTVWKLVETAVQKKYDTRVGFEDTIFLPDGKKAKSNAELISYAVSLKNNKKEFYESTSFRS